MLVPSPSITRYGQLVASTSTVKVVIDVPPLPFPTGALVEARLEYSSRRPAKSVSAGFRV
jgi:hypothetical protein